MTPEEFRSHGHALIDLITEYLEGIEQRPVSALVKPGEVRAGLPEHPPAAPEPFASVLDDLRSIVMPGLTHWQHPQFFAYFPANISYASILGELTAAGFGVQGMSWITSPACTEIETLMLDWMQELLALPARFRSTDLTGGGVIQGSASEATLVAILSARWRATGGRVNADGDTSKLVAYATSQAHSSVEKGLRIAGIGTDRIRTIAHDASFAMVPDGAGRGDHGRQGRRTRAVLRLRDTRHDIVDGVRSDSRDRRDLPRPRRVAPRRRGDERYRRARHPSIAGSTTGWTSPTATAPTRTSGWASTSTAISTGRPTGWRCSAR